MAYTDQAPPPMMPMPPPPGPAQPPVQPMQGMPQDEITFDVKLKRCIKSGQVKVKVLPPEDFLLDPSATVIDDEEGRFYADVARMTRSDAKLKWPDKEDIIDEIPVYTEASDGGSEKQARESRKWHYRETDTDKATEIIEVTECYVKMDYDGDGVAEWRQVCMAGLSGKRSVLSNEEWGGPVPYVSITPQPMPHRYRGRSIYDDVGQVQRIKTVLLRQCLDNLYLTNNPTKAANAQAIENRDALLTPEVGGVVWVNGDPNSVVSDIVVPFTAEKVLPTLEYWDMALEKRTGVSRSTMALDVDALQHQTATAVNAQQSAAFTKVEAYARNIAECGGFKRLFAILLKLFVENQKSVKHIKLRDNFIAMDPRGWDADMNVTINVGLGAGSRDRDLAMLNAIAQKQEMAIQFLQDPFNPICNVAHLFDTYRKMAETAGMKSPETHFMEISQEQVSQFAQMKAQNPQPSPEQIKAQTQMQIEQMKAQNEQQRDQNRAILDEKQAQQKAQVEMVQAEADVATAREKNAAEMALEERRFELEREKMLLEFRLKVAMERAKLVTMGANTKTDEMGNQVGPDPGAIEAALANFDAMPLPAMRAEKTDESNQMMASVLAQVAQSLQQLAASQMAPTEIIRDPVTNRAVGAQKRLN